METLKINLSQQISHAERLALLGVGSDLRGDDAAGMLVARRLAKTCGKMGELKNFKIFLGDTAPENLTGEVKKFNPTHLLIVDSADMNELPGAVKLIDPESIEGFSSSTHSLPLNILADYLIKSIGCKIIIIGIQPKVLEFGSCLSAEVEKSVEDISRMIKLTLKSKNKAHA